MIVLDIQRIEQLVNSLPGEVIESELYWIFHDFDSNDLTGVGLISVEVDEFYESYVVYMVDPLNIRLVGRPVCLPSDSCNIWLKPYGTMAYKVKGVGGMCEIPKSEWYGVTQ